MKNLIMFFVLVIVMVFSSYEVSYSQEENDGLFLFLIGKEGNEKAIMYLHIVGSEAYGSYYTENQSIEFGEYYGSRGGSGSFDGMNLKLSYRDDNYRERTITGILSLEGIRMDGSGGGIAFKGKRNSKNINLSLANTPVSLAVIKEEDWSKEFIFNVRTLDNLNLYALDRIVYLDENIIIFNSLEDIGVKGGPIRSHAYSINTGKEIRMQDFIKNLNDRNLLAILIQKRDGDSFDNLNFDDFDDLNFIITPKGIVFYIENTHTELDMYFYSSLTFEELKPFIKRGSVLEYLFN